MMAAIKALSGSLWGKGIGLFVAVFTIWHVTVDTLWMPLTAKLAHTVITAQYEPMDMRLEQGNNHQWGLVTNTFRASQAWPNNSYKPALSMNHKTKIEVGNLKGYTLGLPLLWLLILLMSKQKIKQLIYTTICLQALIVVTVIVLFNHKISLILVAEPLLRMVSLGGYIQLPPQLPTWLPLLLKPLVDVLAMTVTMIAPIVLSLACCRPWWRGQLSALYLSRVLARNHP
jgi:hypothetical protein